MVRRHSRLERVIFETGAGLGRIFTQGHAGVAEGMCASDGEREGT